MTMCVEACVTEMFHIDSCHCRCVDKILAVIGAKDCLLLLGIFVEVFPLCHLSEIECHL